MYATADMLLTSPQAHAAAEQTHETAIEGCWLKQFWKATATALRGFMIYTHPGARHPAGSCAAAEVDDLVQDIFLHAFKSFTHCATARHSGHGSQ